MPKRKQPVLSFYVGAKFSKMEPAVQDLIDFIKGIGHKITFDWTRFKVSKPYGKNRKHSALASRKMIQGVMHADIVIIITDARGLGIHIETGAALATAVIMNLIKGKKKKTIFLVGMHNTRSVFYYDDCVVRVSSIRALKRRLQNL